MEMPKERTLGKRRSKDQDLKAGHDWHLPRPKEDPEGWRQEVRSEGLRKERDKSERVQKALWALESCLIFIPNEMRS